MENRMRMALQAAKEIKDNDVVLVGVGLPNIAANFAKKIYSPRLVLVYESGSIDCAPDRQPLSIGDPSLSENVSALYSLFDVFSYLISGGRINVGYLGAAQIDSSGHINTTVIGDYYSPKVRLPGSGGACEILYYANKSVVLIELSEAKFRDRVDFVTSSMQKTVGEDSRTVRDEVIITDKCVIRARNGGRPEIASIYQDTDTSELRRLAEKLNIVYPNDVRVLEDPTEREIEILESMDPKGGTQGR